MAETKERLSGLSSETLALAGLSDDAICVLSEYSTPMANVEKLSSVGLFPDAIKYLAHSLEGRSCIVWSLSCARRLHANATPVEQNAMLSVEKWLAEPTDAHRRAAQAAAEEARLSSPAGCIAIAVFFSEGSIAPPEVAAVPAPPRIAQKIAAAGIILAVVEDPEKASDRYRSCVQLGLQATT